jgi:hypothetical protein
VFPWSIIVQIENNRIKLLKEYENVTQKVVFDNAVLVALKSERKCNAISQNGDCSRKINMRIIVFSKQSPLSKRNVVTDLNMKKMHLQIMLPEFGSSNFKRLVTLLRSKHLHSKF